MAVLLAVVAGSPARGALAADATAPAATRAGLAPIPRADGMTRILVTLRTGFSPEGRLSTAQSALQRAGIRAAQQSVLGRLAGSSYRLIAAYEVFPVLAMHADAAALAQLRSAPEVRSVQEDIPVPPGDVESNAAVRVAVPWGNGYDGAGWAVAVLDTGVQTGHPYLADKTIAEACFSSTHAAEGSVSLCPNGQSTAGATPGQSGAGAGANCDPVVTGCDHGTHVAGIAVGRDYVGGPGYDGVARGAKLIAIQVFSKFTTTFGCGSSPVPCVRSYASDQLAALQHLYTTLRPAFSNIASVNMSLGGGQHFAACDATHAAHKLAIDTLRSVNIATVISAGNDGYPAAIGAPACVSTAVSVGAIDDADAIAGFSNRAPFMSLFAPGVAIGSSVPTSAFADKNGTSMAAPLVAGAWALMMQKHPTWTVAQVLNQFQSTGAPTTIAGGTVSRIRLGDAFGFPTLPLTVTKGFAPDHVPYGASSTLTITLTNPNGVALTGTAVTDTYPFGMTNSAAPAGATTCGGTVAAAPYRRTVTLAGGTIPANGSCAVTVQITATTSAGLVNTIEPHGVNSTDGGQNAAAAAATLTVQAAASLIQDGGFELGDAATPWTQASTHFGTPLCTSAACGGAAPRSGAWFAWFGGTTAAETASIAQTGTIGAGPKLLSFHLWWPNAPDPAATFKVSMNGTAILSLTGATSTPYAGGYTPVTIDVSDYANGAAHTLEFEGVNAAGTASTNIFVDDIALTSLPPSYTVSFNSNGGTAVPSQTVDYGATATAPAAPTRAGHVFEGWYADAALTSAFSFATPIKADRTLFARFAELSFLVQDGGFELGAAASPWTQASTNFGTPLCTAAACGGGAPRSGAWFAWFGGTTSAETASLTQSRAIATGPKVLTFHLWWPAAPDPTATFRATMDGATIFSVTGATRSPYAAGYTPVGVDVSSYADGNPHTLGFEHVNAAGGVTSVFLDDVALVDLAATPLMIGSSSRKTHAGAGPFDLPLASTPPNPTTEPRSGGAGAAHLVVFEFDRTVVGGAAAVTEGIATAGPPAFNGSEMSVPLTGVADAQYVTVTVSSVASSDGGVGGTGSARVGFLLGDVNGSRSVTLSDVLSVNGVLTQTVSSANFLRDVNASGTSSLADKLLVNSSLTRSLPSP